MDKFLDMAQNVPTLSAERLNQMTELALSYRQQVPGNENRKAGFFSLRWASAFSAMACVVIALGVFAFNTPTAVAPIKHQVVADADDTYDDLTDIALLQTLDSF